MGYERLSPGIYRNTDTGQVEHRTSVPAGSSIKSLDAKPEEATPEVEAAYKKLIPPYLGASINSSFAERMRNRVGRGVGDPWNEALYLTPEQRAAHRAFVAENPTGFDAEGQKAMDEQVKLVRLMTFGRV